MKNYVVKYSFKICKEEETSGQYSITDIDNKKIVEVNCFTYCIYPEIADYCIYNNKDITNVIKNTTFNIQVIERN